MAVEVQRTVVLAEDPVAPKTLTVGARHFLLLSPQTGFVQLSLETPVGKQGELKIGPEEFSHLFAGNPLGCLAMMELLPRREKIRIRWRGHSIGSVLKVDLEQALTESLNPKF